MNIHLQNFWRTLQRWLIPQPPLGSPENPEILDPGAPPRPKVSRGPLARVKLLLSLIASMITVAVPAAVTLWISASLFETGTSEGGLWAWIPLVILAPITLSLTLLAVVMEFILILAFIGALFGRTVVRMQFAPSGGPFNGQGGPFAGGSFGGGPFGGGGFQTRPGEPRDVSPKPTERLNKPYES